MDKFRELLSCTGLSLDRLRNFCIIADAGGLTRASDGDPARLSLYSRQIKELEAFFGVELKRRSGKGIALTDAGRELARLARAHLIGLDDFKRSVSAVPKNLTIASGNSMLEWFLLPRIAAFSARMPRLHLRLLSLPTRDIVPGIADHRIDFGLIRAESVPAEFRSKKLGAHAEPRYALFVPRQLSRGLNASNLSVRLAHLPLTTSMGGQFRERLETEASATGWELRIGLSCSSFTQAARAVELGTHAAVLPELAVGRFATKGVVRFDLPFLKSYVRRVALAWHPRAAAVRETVAQASAHLSEILSRQEIPEAI